ncbi:MAG: hypothetical protein IT289_00020 [Oligoflexia bacterium]|nr:hypothetical protein [Oligoflexia bacterium]
MTDQAAQIISEVNQMREQYLSEVGEDRRRAWPKSIRERILHLDAMEMNRKEIARLTGVPYETIMQWRYYQKKMTQFHALEVRKNATVTVASRNSGPEENATVTVTSPSGYRVEGVPDAVIRVLKGLGRV